MINAPQLLKESEMAQKLTGNRKPIAPEVEVKDENVRVTRHPSFATLGFNTVHGGGGSDLFGANVRVSNTIRMRIERAHLERGSVDRVYDDGLIVEVEMTEAQFTQAITSFGRGTGTPVTLCMAPDVDVAPVPYPQISEIDVEERMKKRGDERVEAELVKIKAAFEAVLALSQADGSVSKKALQGAVKSLGHSLSNLPGNLDYYKELLREDVEKFMTDAKIELHASANRLLSEGGRHPLRIDDDSGVADV
jgi:hypothetical protein